MTTTAYTAENWPIAAAMLPFGSIDSHGGPIHDAEPEEWAKHLRLVARGGFTEVDPTDTWVRVADLSPERLTDFQSVLKDAGLTGESRVLGPADDVSAASPSPFNRRSAFAIA